MKIHLHQAGKKYFNQWIFRKLNLDLEEGDSLAILGPNGSGKSTLLQVLSGAILLNEGTISYSNKINAIDPEEVFRHLAIAAPYLELIEEFTLEESIKLHFSFKNPIPPVTVKDVIELSELGHAIHKPVRFFSSGMKQRLKLALACLSDTPLLLLDEPCANLDSAAVEWYASMIRRFIAGRTVVVCSNSHPGEHSFCKRQISMQDYKELTGQKNMER